MLPRGVLSGIVFPVTSKYIAALSRALSCDFDKSVRCATVWKGAWLWFHSTLAFSIQKLSSWQRPLYVIVEVSRNCNPISKLLIVLSSSI